MFKKLLLIVVLLFTTCCTNPSGLHPVGVSHSDKIGWIKGSTVAMVVYNDRAEKSMPYCAGVWVSNTEILTALHCARAAKFFEEVKKLSPADKPFAPFIIDENTLNPMGVAISYAVEPDMSEIGQDPAKTHGGKVIAMNEGYDLALIKAYDGDIPLHYIGRVADVPTSGNSIIGQEVIVCGHPRRLVFSVSYGKVAAIRQTIPEEDSFKLVGPFVQIGGYTIEPGNSGGAAWNQNEEIVGIVSFTYGARSYGFVIHADNIRKFLKDAHKPAHK